nr:MarR family transcriptional regulator [Paenibacillus polymyxa]
MKDKVQTMELHEQDDKYHELDNKASIIYKFVMTYSDYIKAIRDYGTGEEINMVEVHTLTMIEENPGITAAKLSLEWNRTKGATSQILKKLEQRGFILRKKENGNAKNLNLYATEKGEALSKAHKLYDIKELMWADKTLHESFSSEEIKAFYNVMQRYTEMMLSPRNE